MSTDSALSTMTSLARRARRAGVRMLSSVEAHTGFAGGFPGRHDAVLMYHAVGSPERFGNVSVERLRRDLEYLTSRFEVVDLESLTDPADEKRVAVTFDDACTSFYEHALPLFREFGVPVTVFVPVGFVDGGNSRLDYRFVLSPTETHRFNDPDAHRDTPVDAIDVMTAARIGELADEPLVALGNHTRTHPDLKTVTDRETLKREIVGAKRELETRFGVTVDRFSFPFGRYTPAALSVVRDSHSVAVTARHGLVDAEADPHLLPRLHTHLPEARLHVDLTDARWWPRRRFARALSA